MVFSVICIAIIALCISIPWLLIGLGVDLYVRYSLIRGPYDWPGHCWMILRGPILLWQALLAKDES